jgi:hypothetical protein
MEQQQLGCAESAVVLPQGISLREPRLEDLEELSNLAYQSYADYNKSVGIPIEVAFDSPQAAWTMLHLFIESSSIIGVVAVEESSGALLGAAFTTTGLLHFLLLFHHPPTHPIVIIEEQNSVPIFLHHLPPWIITLLLLLLLLLNPKPCTNSNAACVQSHTKSSIMTVTIFHLGTSNSWLVSLCVCVCVFLGLFVCWSVSV